MHHHHQQPKKPIPFVKLPSFNGDSHPNVYLGWEAKVEQIFSVYDVDEDQHVKLASLKFEDYAMKWLHQIVLDIGLKKMSIVVSWNDLKVCMRAVCYSSL